MAACLTSKNAPAPRRSHTRSLCMVTERPTWSMVLIKHVSPARTPLYLFHQTRSRHVDMAARQLQSDWSKLYSYPPNSSTLVLTSQLVIPGRPSAGWDANYPQSPIPAFGNGYACLHITPLFHDDELFTDTDTSESSRKTKISSSRKYCGATNTHGSRFG